MNSNREWTKEAKKGDEKDFGLKNNQETSNQEKSYLNIYIGVVLGKISSFSSFCLRSLLLSTFFSMWA